MSVRAEIDTLAEQIREGRYDRHVHLLPGLLNAIAKDLPADPSEPVGELGREGNVILVDFKTRKVQPAG